MRIPHIRSDASGETVHRIFARNDRQHRLRVRGKARGNRERAGGSGYGQRCILARVELLVDGRERAAFFDGERERIDEHTFLHEPKARAAYGRKDKHDKAAQATGIYPNCSKRLFAFCDAAHILEEPTNPSWATMPSNHRTKDTPMPRENLTQKRERAAEIERRLYEYYGEGECSLDHEDPFTLTIAVILSAQCTDAAVNKVTPELFSRFGTPEAMAHARVEDIEAIIHPLGFFRSKAKNIVACAQTVLADFGGTIPNDIDALQTLPGVGRKNRQRRHVPGISQSAGHRRRHARVSHSAQARIRNAQRRYTAEDRGQALENLPAARLAVHQSPVGAFRARVLQRTQPEMRNVPD